MIDIDTPQVLGLKDNVSQLIKDNDLLEDEIKLLNDDRLSLSTLSIDRSRENSALKKENADLKAEIGRLLVAWPFADLPESLEQTERNKSMEAHHLAIDEANKMQGIEFDGDVADEFEVV